MNKVVKNQKPKMKTPIHLNHGININSRINMISDNRKIIGNNYDNQSINSALKYRGNQPRVSFTLAMKHSDMQLITHDKKPRALFIIKQR